MINDEIIENGENYKIIKKSMLGDKNPDRHVKISILNFDFSNCQEIVDILQKAICDKNGENETDL